VVSQVAQLFCSTGPVGPAAGGAAALAVSVPRFEICASEAGERHVSYTVEVVLRLPAEAGAEGGGAAGGAMPEVHATVRALPGRLRALSVFPSESLLYGTFVWTRRALNSRKRRFPAWAGGQAVLRLRPPAQAAALGVQGHVQGRGPDRARSHCRFAPPTHPLHTIFTNIIGASLSEATMRLDPRSG
jgi:hypothetical protein